MKNTIRKITALTLAVLTLGAATSCGRDKPEEINDSQESSSTAETSEPPESVPDSEKITITIGMPFFDEFLVADIREFTKANPQYKAEMVYYSQQVENDDFYHTKAINLMKLDLISGKAPDIIFLSNKDMADFVNKGAFVDLYELMEQYGGVKKEDFLPNVIEGLEIDGQLPAACYGFSIDTVAAKTKHVGEDMENWTPEEAMAAYYSMPEGMQFNVSSDSTYFTHFMVYKAMFNSIDFRNHTCDFLGGSFVDLLEFCCENPITPEYQPDLDAIPYEEVLANISEGKFSIIKDKQLLEMIHIVGFNSYVGNQVGTRFNGEDITFVGYPSETGDCAVTDAGFMFGISESCENKEAAWAIVNHFFSDEYQNKINDENTCNPVIKSVLDEKLADRTREDPNSIYSTTLYKEGTDELSDDKFIKKETVQQVYDYILNVEFSPYKNEIIQNMVVEECAAALAGEKTAEEVAEILQGRVEIYLSERS